MDGGGILLITKRLQHRAELGIAVILERREAFVDLCRSTVKSVRKSGAFEAVGDFIHFRNPAPGFEGAAANFCF